MKSILYVIIPVVAFVIILSNAFFGHLLFESDSEQVANKYSIYVHLQPEWKSNPKNMIFDVTNSWYKSNSDENTESINDSHNSNQLRYQNNKSYVELKHDFSECQDEWNPILYRKAIDTVRHELEYLQGSQLSTNPNISIYPDIDNQNYNLNSQNEKIKDGYVQFIPICTSSEITSYDYSIKADNADIGFNVYFVSSEQQRDNFFDSDFTYYEQPGCYAENKKSFSGTCFDVGKNSGLLVVIPDELNPWVTKITVNLYEKI